MIDGYLLGKEVELEEEVMGDECECRVSPLIVEVIAPAKCVEESSVEEEPDVKPT